MGYDGSSVWKNVPGLEEYAIKAVKGRYIKEALNDINETFGTDITYSQLHSFVNNHHIVTGLGKGHYKGKKLSWTEEEERYLIEHRNDSLSDVASYLGKTECAVSHRKTRLGIRSDTMGRFTAGRTPSNTRPEGYERHSDKRQPYVKTGGYYSKCHGYVPLKDAKWKEYNGREIPEGHRVVFADGDFNNLSNSNLVLMTISGEYKRRGNLAVAQRNGKIPDELRSTVSLISVIDDKIGEKQE